MSNINISTLNLCLSLPSKKDNVTEMLKRNNVKICCLQETEIPNNFRVKMLNSGGYSLELESNPDKISAGIYLKSDLKYVQRNELEKKTSTL